MKMDRFAVAVLFLPVIFLLMPVISTAASPGEQSTKEPGIEGFRALRWGTTEEEAKAAYPDFVFERYILSDGGKEAPSRLYIREKEDRLLFGVSFEKRDPTEVRKEIEQILRQNASAPFNGLAGEKFVNVLEINLALHKLYGKPS